MNYYFITGTSRGIGRALAELLLEDENNYVVGFSRTKTLKHPNFEHIKLDFNKLKAVKHFQFIPIVDASKIVLVNNAGRLGELKHVGNLLNDDLIENFNVNTISPAILTNNFLAAYSKLKLEKIILTVSSGAGRHPVESWSSYCASKSALDMYSKTVDVEQKLLKNNTHIFSIAPAIVDTQMQDEIRSTPVEDFSEVDRFHAYKTKNQLLSPQEVAQKLKLVLDNPENFKEVILDIRTF